MVLDISVQHLRQHRERVISVHYARSSVGPARLALIQGGVLSQQLRFLRLRARSNSPDAAMFRAADPHIAWGLKLASSHPPAGPPAREGTGGLVRKSALFSRGVTDDRACGEKPSIASSTWL